MPTVILAGLIFLGVLWLYGRAVITPPHPGLVWHVWYYAGALTLMACAIELAWMIVWGIRRQVPWRPAAAVAATLSDDDLVLLKVRAPRVAIIVPANGEANTAADAASFADRLGRTMENLVLPSHVGADVFLLFDTDPARAGNEQAVANELGLVRGLRERLAGLPGGREAAGRLHVREYRSKPADRRSKQGSIDLWLAEDGPQFDFVLVLDADSSFGRPDADVPESCAILDRLVVAMLKQPQLAMIQCPIVVAGHSTMTGWQQHLSSRLAANYYGPLHAWVFGPQHPSYGHNVLFRGRDMRACYDSGVPLQYLSHDFIEAATLAAMGRGCVYSDAVISLEAPEDAIDGYLARDQRWARGNCQWMKFLLTRARLPLGPRVFLLLGVLCYFLPLCATTFLAASVGVVHSHGQILPDAVSVSTVALLTLVVTALLGPKLLARIGTGPRSRVGLKELLAYLLIGTITAPPLMCYAGVFFIMALVQGARWKLRASRHAEFNRSKAWHIVSRFLPVSLAGAALLAVVAGDLSLTFGDGLLVANLLLLIVSPLTMLLVSAPLKCFDPATVHVPEPVAALAVAAPGK